MNSFAVEHYDKDNNLKNTYKINNGVTTEGKNHLLNVGFHNVAGIDIWYVGLVNNAGFTAETLADTLASHAGWTEFTAYSFNRQPWSASVANAGHVGTFITLEFAITADGTIKGIFVCSAETGTTGVLWAIGDFDSPVVVSIGDTLRVNYVVNG